MPAAASTPDDRQRTSMGGSDMETETNTKAGPKITFK